MAFIGTPVVKQIADNIVRIAGVALPAADGSSGSGTIGLSGASGSPPDIRLPEAFNPQPYRYGNQNLSLQNVLEVTVVVAEDGLPLCNPAVVKGGSTSQDFRITLLNPLDEATPDLEIWVKYHT